MARLFLLACLLSAAPFFAQKIELKTVHPLLEFPVDIASTGSDGRLFVVGENGKIQVVHPDGALTIFMDISDQIHFNFAEQGLLGMAFDPNFKQNGFFYLFFTGLDSSSTVARFSVTADPDVADPASKLVILNIPQISVKHKGGCLRFGPDGYLYVSTGDSSLGGDPANSSQDWLTLLGKILRIDVTGATAAEPYKIPPSNPFFGFASRRNEIWAEGFRNPWRFSFDRETGDLWVGDVGQDTREEVDFQPVSSPGGLNYGWRCWEGSFNFDQMCGPFQNFEPPILEYQNPGGGGCGASVTGGHVYRGTEFSDLQGWYIYSDACQGWFRGIKRPAGGGQIDTATFLQTGLVFNFSAFGEDEKGELYVVGNADHHLYKITDWCVANPAAKPVVQQNDITLSTSGAASYQWLTSGQPIAGATDSVFTPIATGFYSVKIRDANGCPAASDSVLIAVVATAEPVGEAGLSISPNPTTGFIQLKINGLAGKVSSVELTNGFGQIVLRKKWNGSGGLDFSNLPPGVYQLTVEMEAGGRLCKKLEITPRL